MQVASWAADDIVADILGPARHPSIVPLAALMAPLAQRFAKDLDVFYASSANLLVIERIAAVRSLPVVDGQLLEARTEVTGRARGEIRLVAGSVEAFRCEIQSLALPADRLALPLASAHRQHPDSSTTFRVEPALHLAYAELSGDFNPLHIDRDLCARIGLPERIVHGTLLATLAEALAQAGETGAMTVRFASPCCVGEALAALVLQRPQGTRVMIHGGDGRLVCAMDWRP